MNTNYYSTNQLSTRAFGYPQGGSQPYPGLGASYPGYAQNPFALGPVQGAGGASKGLFGGFNMADLGNVINRMGGIDGIISTMGKVQRLVSGVQQFAPMLKLLAGSFLPGARTTDKDKDNNARPRKRSVRQRRRPSASSNRRTGRSRRTRR